MRVVLAILILAGTVLAEDAYFRINLVDLELTEGRLPGSISETYHDELAPWAVLDGPGEAYVDIGHLIRSRQEWQILVARAPKGSELTGTLALPTHAPREMVRLRFRLPAGLADPGHKSDFLAVKYAVHERLFHRSIPGAAIFRHRMIEAEGKPEESPLRRPARERESEFEGTFSFFTGGRAVSENLQLHRTVPGGKLDEATVALQSLKGITVEEMDWQPHIEGLKPEVDPLARFVPTDQYALFFPSFEAMLDLIDVADSSGTPILHAVEPRAEDAKTRERYERQLCVGLDALVRALGPRLIKSMALTGSDPYLRTGTDVAILFEARDAQALYNLLLTRRHASAPKANRDAGLGADVAYDGIHTPDRAISSYQGRAGKVVVLSNSLAQLKKVLATREGLASLPEYTFFRNRYALGAGEETALLVIPDAAIRKWCGPRWRIASSRRIRAAAVMAQQEAIHLDRLVAGKVETVDLTPSRSIVDVGDLTLGRQGAVSSIYNTRRFLTPVSELSLTHVTEAEARFYRVWRDGYQRNWSNFFDPIAARFSVTDERLAVDLTVMPLILGTQYSEIVQIVRGASIRVDGGDLHAGSLVHLAMALNSQSPLVLQAGNTLQMMSGKLGVHPFAWVGETVAIYLDDDEVFEEAMKSDEPGDYLEENLHRIPLAIHCDVKSPLKLAAFLASTRAFVQQSAPGSTVWETRKHGETQYVVVTSPRDMEKLTICYATLPDAFIA
ncbi:MAG: hypothetical protein ACYSX0_19840, partial [Planctomycetota bacterium]